MGCSLYFLVCLFAVYLETCSSKEAIIKLGTMEMWSHTARGVGGTGELWSGGTGYYRTCGSGDFGDFWLISKHVNLRGILADTIYLDVDAEFTTCLDGRTSTIVPCYSNYFEVYINLGKVKLVIPSTGDIKGFLLQNFHSIYNITDYNITLKRHHQSFTFFQNKSKGVTFAIRSRGACGTLYRMKMYYNYCDETFINSIKFRNTSSPANGFKQVYANCSVNSSPSNDENNLKGLCYSNGTWIINNTVKCSCSAGYEPSSEHGCQLCQVGHFKPNISNTRCIPCPSNSNSSKDRINCTCKDGYYNLTIGLQCFAPLRITGKVKTKQIDTANVNISWSRPVSNGGLNETIFYDVECYSCLERGTTSCKQKCDGAFNLTRTFVVVSKLEVGVEYVFRVYPRNRLNDMIKRDKWNYTEVRYEALQTTRQTGPSKGDDQLTLYYIIGVVGLLAVILLAFVVVFVVFRRKGNEKKAPNGGFSNIVLDNMHGHQDYIDPTVFEKAEDAVIEFTRELDHGVIFLDMLIGGGEFGDVYKGKLKLPDKSKIAVAVKTLKHDATPKSEKDFLLEASIMGQFNNPNVVRLHGVVMKSKPRMIVLEYMSNGSLDNFLKSNDDKLTQLQLIGMARGVAGGMKYLSRIKFIHRDLAARNILLNDSLLCKISDFGLSRELDSTQEEYATSGGKIPVRWTAPEAISYRKFSSSSDVWSYGILLWEIFSFAERPYWEWDNLMVIAELERGYRLPSPMKCPKGVHDLMLHCWEKERVDRPTFSKIALIMDKWIRSPETMEETLDFTLSLERWLESIKMDTYSDHFTAAGYEKPDQIVDLRDEDLRELGITLIGHRNKILKSAVSLHLENPYDSVDV